MWSKLRGELSPFYFTERIWSGWREQQTGPNSQQQRVLASFTRLTLSYAQGTLLLYQSVSV